MDLSTVPNNFRDFNFFIRTSTNYQTSGECVLYFEKHCVKVNSYDDRVVILYKKKVEKDERPSYEYVDHTEYIDFNTFKETELFGLIVAAFDGNPDSSWMDRVSFESTTLNNSNYVLEYEFTDNSPYTNGWCYSTTPVEISINLFSDKLKIAWGPELLETTYQDIFTGVRLLEQLRSNGFDINKDSLTFNFE